MGINLDGGDRPSDAGQNANQNRPDPDCGNGVVQSGEECDDGTANSDTEPDACRTDCRLAYCGDGVVDTLEECDDGNGSSHDGCSRNCEPETPRWIDVTPEDSPFALAQHAMAADASRGRIVLYGGWTAWTTSSDTWEYDGTVWDRVSRDGPPSLFEHAMVFDAARNRVVVFGGFAQGGPDPMHTRTYEYDGTVWADANPSGVPSGREGLAMAFDAARNRVVLFGGRRWEPMSTEFLSDTWEYDGSWVHITLSRSPSARRGHAMAFDAARNRVVLFGGEDEQSELLDEVWEYDGSHWVQITAAAGPPARRDHVLTYHPGIGRVVLFGGLSAGGTRLGDTWELDGSEWVETTPELSPSARGDHAMAYHAPSFGVILFGGGENDYPEYLDATWLYIYDVFPSEP